MFLRSTLPSALYSLPPKPYSRRISTSTASFIRVIVSLTAQKSPPLYATLRSFSSLSSSSESLSSSLIAPCAWNPTTIVPGYLSCSLPDKKPLNVALLLSGGVDSSVALRLLHAAVHSYMAFYLKIWFQVFSLSLFYALFQVVFCLGGSASSLLCYLKYAKSVCHQVDVPLEIVHLTDEYWSHVVSYSIEEYRHGRTPNPYVLCNTRIKFGAFVDAVGGRKFDFVASGHYAKVVHPDSCSKDEPSTLELSKYMVKDQTYFLSHLSQSQLKGLIFPLGCISKVSARRFRLEVNLTSGLGQIIVNR
ncbi:uncharacterized protein [Primulina huaijiensis]|uniref:uncharacterized protein n=1 Tax=Primulina huaijiensis TaxID=1492673 RepID=UPI003CC71D2B